MFEPEEYLGQNLTKIDWNYDLPVVSCVNEHLGEKLGVQDRFEGREEVTFVCSVTTNNRNHHNLCSPEEQPEGCVPFIGSP